MALMKMPCAVGTGGGGTLQIDTQMNVRFNNGDTITCDYDGIFTITCASNSGGTSSDILLNNVSVSPTRLWNTSYCFASFEVHSGDVIKFANSWNANSGMWYSYAHY